MGHGEEKESTRTGVSENGGQKGSRSQDGEDQPRAEERDCSQGDPDTLGQSEEEESKKWDPWWWSVGGWWEPSLSFWRRERQAYSNAQCRCENPELKSYRQYGGRGICFRFESFEQFFAEIGPRPSPGHSLDRINNDGHYEPGNVRWATMKEQAANRRPRWKK